MDILIRIVKEGACIRTTMEKDIVKAEAKEILIGEKYGCLQVIDAGEEYLQIMEARICKLGEEKTAYIQADNANKLMRKGWSSRRGEKELSGVTYSYKPKNFKAYNDAVSIKDFDKEVLRCMEAKEVKHYKCICKKCGKVRYYSDETLWKQPKVCYRPIYCASKFTYSVKAQNSTYRKKQKYENDESVCLVNSKEAIVPAAEYCDLWNEERKKKLFKQAEKDSKIIAEIPRKKAKNYDKNFVGLKYESLEVIKCLNEKLESVPTIYYNQYHQKRYHDIIVYKEYLCKCYLCGKEKKVTCDKFGIYPPTPYGYRAYNGYWSEVYCDCHEISSFQWIVNDILLKYGIEYYVEVPVNGIYGMDGETPLRFDFAIYKKGHLFAFIECQGEQHYMSVLEFGGEHKFFIQQRNDEEKRKYTKRKNIKLICNDLLSSTN